MKTYEERTTMSVTFKTNPTDMSGKTFLYPHEDGKPCAFTFEPGVTILVGANGAGKTTLVERMRDALKREKTPNVALIKDSLDHEIEAHYEFARDIDALVTLIDRNHMSEGQGAKSTFDFLLPKVRVLMRANIESNERWVLIDGMDSSQSIDQLRGIAKSLDSICEEASRDVTPYVIVTTNNFELARDRHCLCVSENVYTTPKTYRDFSAAVMRSARYLKKRRAVSDRQWDDVYSDMQDTIERN